MITLFSFLPFPAAFLPFVGSQSWSEHISSIKGAGGEGTGEENITLSLGWVTYPTS